MKHKKKVLVIGGSVLGALVIGLGIFAGYNYYKTLEI